MLFQNYFDQEEVFDLHYHIPFGELRLLIQHTPQPYLCFPSSDKVAQILSLVIAILRGSSEILFSMSFTFFKYFNATFGLFFFACSINQCYLKLMQWAFGLKQTLFAYSPTFKFKIITFLGLNISWKLMLLSVISCAF